MTTKEYIGRDEAIARIKTALKRRSKTRWSVTGGRGSDWGWITIHVAPSARGQFGYMSDAQRQELATLLGKSNIHCQGEMVPASDAYYREYIARAEGRTPEVCGEQYWD